MSQCLDAVSVFVTTLNTSVATLRSYRMVVPAASISNPGCDVTYIKVKLAVTGNAVISNASIGLRSGTGSSFQTGKFVRLTFTGGNNGWTNPSSDPATVLSDWVAFSNFDEAVDHLIHVDFTSGYARYASGGVSYRKDGALTDALSETLSDYSSVAYAYCGTEILVAGSDEAIDRAKVSQLRVEYLYTIGPNIAKVSQVFVEYLYEPGATPSGSHRIFPVPPTGRVLQSQAGKRVFPIVH